MYEAKNQEILNSLNQYLLQRFNYRKPCARFAHKNIINVTRAKVDLYLRFFDDKRIREQPTIVIARIGFRKQRTGHGKHFLRFISEVAVRHQFKYIEIESCNDDSRAFAKKFGFTFSNKNEWNCRIEVETLIKNLCIK